MGKTKQTTRMERSLDVTGVDQKQNTTHPYTFHVGASWSRKSTLPPQFRSPHPSDKWKEHTLTTHTRKIDAGNPGEDFFFIQDMRNQSGVSIGVADGVGGWSKLGVDPSLFSQTLMYYAHDLLGKAWAGKPGIETTDDEQIEGQEMTPYECLDLAYNRVSQDDLVEGGASTACILNLNASSGLLRSVNLGDSGYIIIRSDDVLYTSSPQEHHFNGPKQLTKIPESIRGIREYYDDKPNEADTHEVQLREGDIVIAYTDGLPDNVFPSEMISTIRSSAAQAGETEDERVQNMADQLVDFARGCMKDKDKVTPFRIECDKEETSFYEYSGGGKPDDITVIVGLVRKTS